MGNEIDSDEDMVELEVIALTDDDGNEYTYVVLSVDLIEGQTYALLATEASYDDESSDTLELEIFEYADDEDDDASLFSPIADDATYDKVKAYFTALLESEGDDD